ncbi:MAG: hypothetical protein ACRENX_02415 [Candidatus Dormibacteria bacterium]
MSGWPKTFGKFGYEFAVGDTPELAVGVAVIIVCAWALARSVGPTVFWVIPVAVVALMGLSLWRGAAHPSS